MPNDEPTSGRAGRNPAAADRFDPLHILIQHADADDFYDNPERSAKHVLRELMALWEALHDAIAEQDEDTRNATSDAYRLHRLYAKYFPDDHAAALAEAEGEYIVMTTEPDLQSDPAGKSEPLRANNLGVIVLNHADLPAQDDSGTAERQRRYVARYDPRRQPQVTDRDIEALLFIGRGHEVAQYQLHAAVFSGLSEGIMSRWTQRMLKRGAIAVERWAKVGINRLRLTPKGRELLVSRGVAVDDVFTPRTPTALKDVQHTLWINDLRVVLPTLAVAPDVIVPAWLLQRRLGTVVPDVLAIRTPRADDRGFALAAEVDLGAERLKSVLLPKLARLRNQLAEWAGGAPAVVLVLTRGERRIAAMRTALTPGAVPVLVSSLPLVTGRPGLRALQDVLAGATKR